MFGYVIKKDCYGYYYNLTWNGKRFTISPYNYDTKEEAASMAFSHVLTRIHLFEYMGPPEHFF